MRAKGITLCFVPSYYSYNKREQKVVVRNKVYTIYKTSCAQYEAEQDWLYYFLTSFVDVTKEMVYFSNQTNNKINSKYRTTDRPSTYFGQLC